MLPWASLLYLANDGSHRCDRSFVIFLNAFKLHVKPEQKYSRVLAFVRVGQRKTPPPFPPPPDSYWLASLEVANVVSLGVSWVVVVFCRCLFYVSELS